MQSETLAAIDANNCLHKLYKAQGAQRAARTFASQLAAITARICEGNAAAVHVAFDGSNATAWRRELVPEYKGTRGPKAADLVELLKSAPAFALDCGYEVYNVEGNEADDIIAAIVTRHASKRVVMVSSDSDLGQLLEPGRVNQLRKFNTERGRITNESYYTAADLVAGLGIHPAQLPDWKTLAGDETDNLRRRVSDETARAILKRFPTLDAATRDQWNIPCNQRDRVAIMNAAKAGELQRFVKVATLRRDCLDFIYCEGGV